MKIREFILVPKTVQDTTSCGTTSSGQKAGSKQDLVSHDLVPEMIDGAMVSHPDHSAITEGVSQILRRGWQRIEARIPMYFWSTKRSYRCQTIYLFRKEGYQKSLQDCQEETAESQTDWTQNGHNQTS